VEASECVARRLIAFGQYHLVEAVVDTWEAAEGSLAEVVDTAQVIAVVVGRDRDCRVVEAAARTRHTAAAVEDLGHARRCAPGRTLALGY
jgi:hypothetical protein